MTTRRQVLTALAFAVLTPGAVHAQDQPTKRMWHVGVLMPRRPVSPERDARYSSLLRGLRDQGYVEGKNTVILPRFAEQMDRLPGYAADLVELDVDVIVAAGNQAITAAQQATTRIPIVMATAPDPVASGFVKSLSQPGGNITGLSNLTTEVTAKHVELLASTVPNLSRVALLYNVTNTAHALILKHAQAAALRMHITMIPVGIRSESELPAAFGSMAKARAGGVIVAVDGMFTHHAARVAELAVSHRLPSMYTTRVFPESGGLMSYGQNFADNYYRAAAYVDKILKGARPADLPVEQSTNFVFVINAKTAKGLGLTIPTDVLLRADAVIE